MSERHKRVFYQFTRSFYADACKDFVLKDNIEEEITFALYNNGGICLGEMAMRWRRFSSGELVPRLEAYADSFRVLATFQDVILELSNLYSNNSSISPEDFCILLKRMGFEDGTREKPVSYE